MAKRITWPLCCAVTCLSVSIALADSFLDLTPYPGWTGPPAVSSGPEAPTFRAVDSQPQWNALWATLRPTALGSKEAAPVVDFARFTMLVAALGRRNTGGNSVQFQYAHASRNGIEVSVLDVRPGHGCTSTTTVTYPIAIALIPHTQQPVSFHIDSASIDCSASRYVH